MPYPCDEVREFSIKMREFSIKMREFSIKIRESFIEMRESFIEMRVFSVEMREGKFCSVSPSFFHVLRAKTAPKRVKKAKNLHYLHYTYTSNKLKINQSCSSVGSVGIFENYSCACSREKGERNDEEQT